MSFSFSKTVFMSNLTQTIKDSLTESNCGSVEITKKKNKKGRGWHDNYWNKLSIKALWMFFWQVLIDANWMEDEVSRLSFKS